MSKMFEVVSTKKSKKRINIDRITNILNLKTWGSVMVSLIEFNRKDTLSSKPKAQQSKGQVINFTPKKKNSSREKALKAIKEEASKFYW